jgi:hypothetical protein
VISTVSCEKWRNMVNSPGKNAGKNVVEPWKHGMILGMIKIFGMIYGGYHSMNWSVL